MNRVDMIGRCIESVAAQSYANKEHVIVDGASTDGTVDVIREYADRYPHIRWISEPDSGLSNAFNKGLAISTGDLIGILGDDDFYADGAFDIVAREAEAKPEAGLIAGDCAYMDNAGRVTKVMRASFTNRRDLLECWVHWGREVTISAPSTFIRKRVIDDVGGFDEGDKYSMDYRHWVKITEKYPVHIVHSTLAQFRFDTDSGDSITAKQQAKQVAETRRISREYWMSTGLAGYLALSWSYFKAIHLRPAVYRLGLKRRPVDVSAS